MAQATEDAVRAGGGRPVPAENLHVTLAFLGSVPGRRLAQLAAIARQVAVVPLSCDEALPVSGGRGLALVFEHLEYWRPAQVLCAVPARPPAPVAALARRLQERLTEGAFVPDQKTSESAGINIAKPFRPHVTLARKALRPPHSMEMAAVTWSLTELVLVESKTHPEGAAYRVLESFNVGNE